MSVFPTVAKSSVHERLRHDHERLGRKGADVSVAFFAVSPVKSGEVESTVCSPLGSPPAFFDLGSVNSNGPT